MPTLKGKGVVFCFPLEIFSSPVCCRFFAVGILCWGLHIDLEFEMNVLTFYLCSSYNTSLKAFKCPGGIFWDVARAVNPTTLFHKGYNTTNQSANPAINTLYNDMLWCWYMNYSMITFVTAACLFSSWRGRIEQSDQSCCLYLEQCTVERLIRRSPNNSNGDGIVCDWCGFVTLYVCACMCERGEEREAEREEERERELVFTFVS